MDIYELGSWIQADLYPLSEKMLRTVLENRELIVGLKGTKQFGVSDLLLTQYR